MVSELHYTVELH